MHTFAQKQTFTCTRTRTITSAHLLTQFPYDKSMAALRSRKLKIRSHPKMKKLVQSKPSIKRRRLFPIKKMKNWLHLMKNQRNVAQSVKRNQRKQKSQRKSSHPLMNRITFKWTVSMKMIWNHRQSHHHAADRRKNHHPNQKQSRYTLYLQQQKWQFKKLYANSTIYVSLDLCGRL